MSIGIYKLWFNNPDIVYIGQSVNIEYRYKKHLQKLKNGTANYKMLAAYAKYGLPKLEILLECDDDSELNELENAAIEVYNSVKSGYNVADTSDIHLKGPDNFAAKYTEEQIEQVFFLLLDLNNSYKDIEKITQVNISTVRHIANTESHTWLSVKYPDKYRLLTSLKGVKRQQAANSAIKRGIVYPPIISPEGIEYTVTNAAEFARQHNLDASCLVKVLKRTPRYISHKGWTLAN